MNIKKSLTLAFNNKRVLFESLISKILTVAIIAGIYSLFYNSSMGEVRQQLIDNKVIDNMYAVGREFVSPNFNINTFVKLCNDFANSIIGLVETMPLLFSSLTATVVIFAICMVLARCFINLNVLPTYETLHTYMTTNVHCSYIISLLKNTGKSFKMFLIDICCTAIIDVLLVLGLIALYVFVLSRWSAVGIILIYLISIYIFSLRYTAFAWWQCNIVCEKLPVSKAMFAGVKNVIDNIGNLFIQTLLVVSIGATIAITLIMFVHIAWAISISLVVLGFLEYILSCMYIVSYYEYKGLPYFVCKVKIDTVV